jgi:hypothetical protein
LAGVSRKFHSGLLDALNGTKFYLQGDPISPLKFVHYTIDEEADHKLDQFTNGLFEKDIVVARARYLEDAEAFPVKKG